jgi:hypothetical protein
LVAFVDLCHRPELCFFVDVYMRPVGCLSTPFAPIAPTTGPGRSHPQKLCADLGITLGHLWQTRMPICLGWVA